MLFWQFITFLLNNSNFTLSELKTLFNGLFLAQEGMKILKVAYDIYCKLFGTNLIKLNLTVCEKSKISILIPIAITEQLNKLNISIVRLNYYFLIK